MTQQYYSILTNIGLAKEAAANSPGGSPVSLTHIAVGDGNGSSYNPVSTQTELVNEVYRTTLTHVAIDSNNSNQLIVEGVLNEEIGPFHVREVGIFDSEGDLFAIGKYPETYKPALASGSGKRLYIRMILGFANAPQVDLILSEDLNNDPNFNSNVIESLSDINSDISSINDDLNSINSSITIINGALAAKLAKAQNLADLEDFAISRNNLNVYDKSYIDTAINGVALPAGSIISYAANLPPVGCLECNGAEINRTTYNKLFNAIGTTFGSGNGSTTFKVPDLRGEFIRGWNHGFTNDPDANLRTNSGNGTTGDNIGTKQSWALENMTGSVNVSSDYGERAKIDGQSGVLTYRDIGSVYNAGAGGFASNRTRGITFNASLSAQTSTETRPRNIALMFCIKY